MGNASIATRMFARLAGEVTAETLEAYQRASGAVFDLFLKSEATRAELAAGTEPATESQRLQLLCAWNAFALQTLGDAFLAADYRANPRTVGFVPPITKTQADRFYVEVERWVRRAREAEANPDFRVAERLPAELPEFVDVEPCPSEHLEAMISACRELRKHGEIAQLDAERLNRDEADGLAKLRQVLSAAKHSAEHAESLWVANPGIELHERIELAIKEALGRYYLAGQLAAQPKLSEHAAIAVAGSDLPLPGTPGFDPWVLTMPTTVSRWKRDSTAQRAIQELWDKDPDPAATLLIHSQIRAAFDEGHIVYATDSRGNELGNYYCCPWSPIFETRRPITIGGVRLRSGQQFTYDVSAEEMGEGGAFKREVMRGNFTPTSEIDYCIPGAD